MSIIKEVYEKETEMKVGECQECGFRAIHLKMMVERICPSCGNKFDGVECINCGFDISAIGDIEK